MSAQEAEPVAQQPLNSQEFLKERSAPKLRLQALVVPANEGVLPALLVRGWMEMGGHQGQTRPNQAGVMAFLVPDTRGPGAKPGQTRRE